MENRVHHRSGQSLVEYVVVLALVAIVVISVAIGIGQRSQARLQAANEALEESRVATSTAGAGKGGKPGKPPKPPKSHDD